MDVLAGSTDVTTYFVLRLAADGTEATGLTITNFDLQYVRSGAAPSTKVDATALAATNSAHSDNTAIEIDATDQPGLYRVDWPDAAFAAGVREVVLTVKCATAFTEHLRVNLTPVPAKLADVAHGGTSATITFERIIGVATTSNADCVSLTGQGSGDGLHLQGGSSGDGLHTAAGASGGRGIHCVSTAAFGEALYIQAAGNNSIGTYTRCSGSDGVGFQCSGAYGAYFNGSTDDVYLVNSDAPTLAAAVLAGTQAEASGRPTTIGGMIRRLFEGRHNKRTRNRTTGVVTIRNAADDGNLETSTQSTASSTDTQTQGA